LTKRASPLSHWNRLVFLAVARSHESTLLPLAAASTLPSGENTTQLTKSSSFCSSSRQISFCVVTFNTRIPHAPLPAASVLPSGENATDMIELRSIKPPPLIGRGANRLRRTSFLVAMSQTTIPSSPPEASSLPSGENA